MTNGTEWQTCDHLQNLIERYVNYGGFILIVKNPNYPFFWHFNCDNFWKQDLQAPGLSYTIDIFIFMLFVKTEWRRYSTMIRNPFETSVSNTYFFKERPIFTMSIMKPLRTKNVNNHLQNKYQSFKYERESMRRYTYYVLYE
jgi:hypothetical protein